MKTIKDPNGVTAKVPASHAKAYVKVRVALAKNITLRNIFGVKRERRKCND